MNLLLFIYQIKEDLSLKDRIFDCPNCKAKLDRDYNASLNIYRILETPAFMRGEYVMYLVFKEANFFQLIFIRSVIFLEKA